MVTLALLRVMLNLILSFVRLCEQQAQEPHPCVCSMTSGAMKQGVPTNVLRDRYLPCCTAPGVPCTLENCPVFISARSMVAVTPKSASSTWPLVFSRTLAACADSR